MKRYTRFAANEFSSLEGLKFSPEEYSRLKFGSDLVAKKFGFELASAFFQNYSDILLSNKFVVIPSPYNYVKNAATMMTEHFLNKLNELVVNANGSHLEYSIIHRKVSYINDYGFLSKEKRRGLINQDSFYLNREFVEGKILIFIDDVRITGTHEDKLIDVLRTSQVRNKAFFLYYGSYTGNNPEIEAALNFSAVKDVTQYVKLALEPNHHIIVRPIKYLLSLRETDLRWALSHLGKDFTEKLYYACLNEGYYRIPAYQASFKILSDQMKEEKK